MTLIKLQSNEGDILEVDIEVAKISIVIKTVIEDLGAKDGDVIPLHRVNTRTLKKVLVWATHHKDDPPPLDDRLIKENDKEKDTEKYAEIDEWDREFLNVDVPLLFSLVEAANYLDIKDLLVAACKSVANLMRRRTPEQIRAVMGIENDFSPEEELQIRMEHIWCGGY